MDNYRYDPANYDVGSDLWVQIPCGWHKYKADRFTVVKKTPSGQVVATDNSREIRISAKGRIAGEAAYGGRRPCSKERAEELGAALLVDRAWDAVGSRADELVHASRQRDREKLHAARDALIRAIDQLPA